jgi:hypothetical protein
MKGYRLHDERIAHSGGTGSMRTMKYELVDVSALRTKRGTKLPLRDRVAESVFEDYRNLYGPLNFSDFLMRRADPSILEFWLLTLKLGVFYGSSRDKLPSEFDAYRGRSGDWQTAFASMDQSLREVLDPNAWRSFMLTGQRGLAAKSPEQRERVVLRLLVSERASDEAAIARLKPLAARFAAEFLEADKPKAFKADLFGVEVPGPKAASSFGMTWVVDPAWEEIDWQPGDDPTQLIEAVMARHAVVYGHAPKQWQSPMGIGSNGSYLNSILGTGTQELLAGKAQELADQMVVAFDFSASERQIIERRMDVLARYMQPLGLPQLVASWRHYRSDLNGTLESWYSNRTARHDVALEQLGTLETALDGLAAILREHDAQGDAVFALADELRRFVADVRAGGLVSADDSRTIRLLQGELRSELAEWRQRPGNTDERLSKGGDIGPLLSANVQSSPVFFGVAQRERYEKLLRLKQDVAGQIDLLVDIWRWALEHADPAAPVTDRAVAALAAGSRDARHDAVRAAYARLERALGVSFADQQDRNRFHIGPFDRQKGLRKLPFRDVAVSNLLGKAGIEPLFEQLRTDPTGAGTLLRDVSRMSATLLASALAAVDEDRSYALSDRSLCTERQRQLLDRSGRGERIAKATLRVLASYVHAELSGAATRLARSLVLERAAIQAVNGCQVELAYETLQTSGNTFQRYYVQHPGFHGEPEPVPFGRPLQVAGQSYNFAAADFAPVAEPVGTYLAIRSSTYQTQFLEWLLGKLPRRETTLRAGGAFTIAERTLQFDWSGDTPRVQAVGDLRLFVSQPFTIVPPREAKQLEPEANPCFMGVDVGEYGLAVAIIRCTGAKVELLHRAFLTDPQHHALAAGGSVARDQVRATMNAPDTRTTRLAQNVAGAYRNQLHSLMLGYNAWPAFDWEVSDYGRGARIAKVYGELKRADVKARDNQAQNRQAWGQLLRDQHRWAKEATAAGTSQTCSRCKRWARFFITDEETYLLRPHPVTGLKSAWVGGLEVVCLSDVDQLKGADLKRAVHAVARPPIDGIALELTSPEVKAMLGDTWKQRRGNMAVFVCPFTDCHHVADADLQAALNIALRGYAKLQSEGKLTKAIDLISFASGLDYEPVGLLSA